MFGTLHPCRNQRTPIAGVSATPIQLAGGGRQFLLSPDVPRLRRSQRSPPSRGSSATESATSGVQRSRVSLHFGGVGTDPAMQSASSATTVVRVIGERTSLELYVAEVRRPRPAAIRSGRPGAPARQSTHPYGHISRILACSLGGDTQQGNRALLDMDTMTLTSPALREIREAGN